MTLRGWSISASAELLWHLTSFLPSPRVLVLCFQELTRPLAETECAAGDGGWVRGLGRGLPTSVPPALVTFSGHMESSEGHSPCPLTMSSHQGTRGGEHGARRRQRLVFVPVSPQVERQTHTLGLGRRALKISCPPHLRGKNNSALTSLVSRNLGIPLLETMLFQSFLALNSPSPRSSTAGRLGLDSKEHFLRVKVRNQDSLFSTF